MDFITTFYGDTLLSIVTALVWFGLPGFGITLLLGFRHQPYTALLLAPTLGICTFGAFSLALNSLIGYNQLNLMSIWLLFQTLVLLLYRLQRHQITEPHTTVPDSLWKILGLLFGSAIWAVVPTTGIAPFYTNDALFTNSPIFDHAKVALVDVMAREGLLPVNPYYAPDGETVPLIYYYTWHFIASQLKLLIGVSGWVAEVSLTWLTSFITLNFLIFLAVKVSQSGYKAGLFVVMLAFMGIPNDFLGDLLGPRYLPWVAIPEGHVLELLWLQAMWVPQHVLSALTVVLLLYLIYHIIQAPQWHTAVIAGLVTATGFGASTWVGGVGLGFALPFWLLAILGLRLTWRQYRHILYQALIAISVCLVFALPALISQASGPPLTEAKLPFDFGVLPATRLLPLDGSLAHSFWHIILFWLQFLPLNLGIAYVLGLFALLWRRNTTEIEKHWWALSFAAVVSFLLIVQFMHSTFWNNSFGWRAVLVPMLLLMVWASVALNDLFTYRTATLLNRYRGHRYWNHLHPLLLSLALFGLSIGIISTLKTFTLPISPLRQPSEAEWAARQGFLRQYDAWQKVRELTAPTDRVQVNPDGYSLLTPWPATLPYALFADRKIAYANVEYATVFAYRYPAEQNQKQYHLIQNIFSTQPDINNLYVLRDQLKVKALLVDMLDPVWSSNALEQSSVYRLAHQEAGFKIYLAN